MRRINPINADSFTFGIELETVSPESAAINVGPYHNGYRITNAPTFMGMFWKAERDCSITTVARPMGSPPPKRRQPLSLPGRREPLFHISSPKHGWDCPNPRPHHEFIDPADLPPCWRGLDLIVEVEAKAKEAAIVRLRATLLRDQWNLSGAE